MKQNKNAEAPAQFAMLGHFMVPATTFEWKLIVGHNSIDVSGGHVLDYPAGARSTPAGPKG